MLLRRSPSQLSPREAMLQRAAAAQQHLQDLLTQQAVGGAALSTLPESAQGVVKSALLKFRQQAELLVQQQAEQLERTIVPAVKAEVRRRPCKASACIFGHGVCLCFAMHCVMMPWAEVAQGLPAVTGWLLRRSVCVVRF